MSSKLSNILNKEQKLAKRWVTKTREDLTLQSLLKKAKNFESKKEYRKALDSYFKFIGLKLQVIKERPQKTLKDYFRLIPYYLKIAECYKKTKHLKPEDRVVDMEKAAQYYQKAAEMSLDQKDYDAVYSHYEESSRTYQEVEEFDNAAMSYVKIALMYFQKGTYLMAASAYVKAGELYEQGSNFEEAGKVYIQAANLDIRLKNLREASTNYGKAGDCYLKLRRYKESIKFYLEASEIAAGLEHYDTSAEMYGKAALDYEKLNDCITGIHYYLKSAQLGGNDIKKASYGGAGRCYENMESFQKAIDYYGRSAKLSLEGDQKLEAALYHRDIARCYEGLGDSEKAASFYFQYADLGKKEDENTKEGYENSSRIYLKNAKKLLRKEKDHALKNYEKAAESYQNLGCNHEAAEIFQKVAEINLKSESYDKVIDAYLKAAQLYETAQELEAAAISYYRAENYQKAAEIYLNSAYQKEKREELFSAGQNYQKAADSYKKLKKDNEAKSNYAKAAHTYLKHLGKLKYLSMNADDPGDKGQTYQKIGESYLLVNNIPEAEKYLQDAFQYFDKNKLERKAILARALLLRTQAELAVRQGDYDNASQFLITALPLFEETLKEEKFSREYQHFLESNKSLSQKILKEISKKPEVTLLLDRHSYTFIDTPVLVNALLKNQTDHEVHNITFLSHLPNHLEVNLLPTVVKKLKGGELKRTSLEIVPKKIGDYRLSPLEVYYLDKDDNKYVKASNQITIKVVEKPSPDYKDYRITVSTFLKYAEIQLKNGNYFHAGEGFWGVAETYGRFNEDIASKENYHKAIEYYLKYSDQLLKIKQPTIVELHSLGDTYKRVGECYERISDLNESEEAYQNAIIYYEKTKAKAKHQEKLKLQYQIMNVQAFLSKVKAKFSIRHGDYQEAQQLLEKAVQLLEESIKKGDFSGGEEKLLEKNQRECQAMRKDIQGKPQITLELSYQKKAIVGTPLIIKVTISNNWDQSISTLRFLVDIPSGFKLTGKLAEIATMKPRETRQLNLEIIPQKPGNYLFKPFDLIYRDGKGNNYMQGCDQVRLEVK